LEELAKVLDELEEEEKAVIEGIDCVKVVIVPDEKPKRKDVYKSYVTSLIIQ